VSIFQLLIFSFPFVFRFVFLQNALLFSFSHDPVFFHFQLRKYFFNIVADDRLADFAAWSPNLALHGCPQQRQLYPAPGRVSATTHFKEITPTAADFERLANPENPGFGFLPPRCTNCARQRLGRQFQIGFLAFT